MNNKPTFTSGPWGISGEVYSRLLSSPVKTVSLNEALKLMGDLL